jgi:predicted ArsR family transcriptional regulator
MTRNEFMKGCAVACAAGLGCSGSARQARAAEEVGCSEELTQIKNRSDAAQLRFARLIETLENNVPAEERKHLLHALGTKCSDTYRPALIDRYIGNLKGFLEQGLRKWMAEARYDEAAGTIRVVDKGPSCSCPMVKVGETPGSFCACTLGWQEATYARIVGRPVKAELEESILRGGKRCVFRMQIL